LFRRNLTESTCIELDVETTQPDCRQDLGNRCSADCLQRPCVRRPYLLEDLAAVSFSLDGGLTGPYFDTGSDPLRKNVIDRVLCDEAKVGAPRLRVQCFWFELLTAGNVKIHLSLTADESVPDAVSATTNDGASIRTFGWRVRKLLQTSLRH